MFMAHLRVGDEKVREREREREMRKLLTRVKNAVVKKKHWPTIYNFVVFRSQKFGKIFLLGQ